MAGFCCEALENYIIESLIYLLFKLSRAIMKARNGIDVVHLGTHQKKNPGAATPGFFMCWPWL